MVVLEEKSEGRQKEDTSSESMNISTKFNVKPVVGECQCGSPYHLLG